MVFFLHRAPKMNQVCRRSLSVKNTPGNKMKPSTNLELSFKYVLSTKLKPTAENKPGVAANTYCRKYTDQKKIMDQPGRRVDFLKTLTFRVDQGFLNGAAL